MVVHQHSPMRANRQLPPGPPTIPGGALNPDPVRPPLLNPHDISAAAAPPGAGVPPAADRHPFLPGIVPPPGAYDVTDPKIFWMNNRPLLLHRSVGKGGFGEVYRAEMMLPPGLEVSRDLSTGGFILDEAGRIEVRRQQRTPDDPLPTEVTSSSSSPAPPPPAESIENIGAPGAGVAEALELSEAAPASMHFFHVEEITENAEGTLSVIEHKMFSWSDVYIQFLSSSSSLLGNIHKSICSCADCGSICTRNVHPLKESVKLCLTQ